MKYKVRNIKPLNINGYVYIHLENRRAYLRYKSIGNGNWLLEFIIFQMEIV